MSLRDLATTALCAPTEAAAGSSSAGTSALAQLAEAVLPSTIASRPEHVATSSAAAAAVTAGQTDFLPEASFTRRQTGTAATAPPEPSNAPYLPIGLFPNPVHHVQAPLPVPVPVPGPPPPIPAPVSGDPTDMFERAFKSSAKPSYSLQQQPPPIQRSAPPVSYATPPVSYASPPVSAWRQHTPFPVALHHPAHTHPPMMFHSPPLPQLFTSTYITPATSAAPASTSASAQVENASSATEQVSSEKAAAELATRALSWSEEFTSLEAMDSMPSKESDPSLLHNVDGPQFDIDNDFLGHEFDETLQSAFQHWLRMDSSETYQFTNAPLDQNASAVRTATEVLQEGVRAHTEGRLSAAVYHLEEALQQQQANKESLSKSKEALAWYVLGLSLADLDDDERAIQALTEGISVFNGTQTGHRREDNPYLWQSLIALAVSHTNELEHSKAFRVIREWLDLRTASQNGEEAGVPTLGGGSSSQRNDLFRRISHEDLVTALNRAASQSPDEADLFIVLGILHNLNRDYQPAATAFRHAASLRPEIPGVWNKLGATLANDGNTDEALRAYRRAVDLQPALVRAWVNVGTAYSNRKESEKAIRYYLKAIALSKESATENKALQGKMSESNGQDGMQHVWGYLRSSLISLSRGDLLQHVESRNADGLRAHFNF